MTEKYKLLVQKAWIGYIREKEPLLNEKIKKFFLNSYYESFGIPYNNGPLGIRCHMHIKDAERTWYFLYNNNTVKFSYGMDEIFNDSELDIISNFCIDFFNIHKEIILLTR